MTRAPGEQPAVNLVMIGPPGAGKGTQAERLSRDRGVPKISTGDMLREAIHQGTDLGLRAKAIVERGDLVGDEVMVSVVQERLSRPDARRGFVLDGFPRTVPQAEALDRILVGRGPLIVLEIVVPSDELMRRMAARRICQVCGTTAGPSDLACGRCAGALVLRSDDEAAGVRERRLGVYSRQTGPIVDYYQRRPTFRSVDGTRSPDHVARALVSAIDSILASTGRHEAS